ncbi:MAG: MerR family transcriptional regulator, partial [Candidatus Binatia bacterium]
MSGYTARDVAKLLALSIGQVRSFVRAGFLVPERGPRGEFRFTFQDLVLLRTAKELT